MTPLNSDFMSFMDSYINIHTVRETQVISREQDGKIISKNKKIIVTTNIYKKIPTTFTFFIYWSLFTDYRGIITVGRKKGGRKLVILISQNGTIVSCGRSLEVTFALRPNKHSKYIIISLLQDIKNRETKYDMSRVYYYFNNPNKMTIPANNIFDQQMRKFFHDEALILRDDYLFAGTYPHTDYSTHRSRGVKKVEFNSQRGKIKFPKNDFLHMLIELDEYVIVINDLIFHRPGDIDIKYTIYPINLYYAVDGPGYYLVKLEQMFNNKEYYKKSELVEWVNEWFDTQYTDSVPDEYYEKLKQKIYTL